MERSYRSRGAVGGSADYINPNAYIGQKKSALHDLSRTGYSLYKLYKALPPDIRYKWFGDRRALREDQSSKNPMLIFKDGEWIDRADALEREYEDREADAYDFDSSNAELDELASKKEVEDEASRKEEEDKEATKYGEATMAYNIDRNRGMNRLPTEEELAESNIDQQLYDRKLEAQQANDAYVQARNKAIQDNYDWGSGEPAQYIKKVEPDLSKQSKGYDFLVEDEEDTEDPTAIWRKSINDDDLRTNWDDEDLKTSSR